VGQVNLVGPVGIGVQLVAHIGVVEARLQDIGLGLPQDRWAFLSALLFTALGEKDRAFEQLERAYQLRDPGLMFLKVAPWCEPLQSDPRYSALAEKLGLG
jgi:hypothetical protein